MTRAEEMRARRARIKVEYNAKVFFQPYIVESQGLHNIWHQTGGWYFENLEDARAYATNEVKGTKRIVKLTMLDEHTLSQELIEEV